MLVMLIAFLVAAFALLCIRVPSAGSALMAIDKPSDPHELGLVVASRTSYAAPSPSNAYLFFSSFTYPFQPPTIDTVPFTFATISQHPSRNVIAR
jgi:hypothetical protein